MQFLCLPEHRHLTRDDWDILLTDQDMPERVQLSGGWLTTASSRRCSTISTRCMLRDARTPHALINLCQ